MELHLEYVGGTLSLPNTWVKGKTKRKQSDVYNWSGKYRKKSYLNSRMDIQKVDGVVNGIYDEIEMGKYFSKKMYCVCANKR